MNADDELSKPDLSGRVLDRYRLVRRIGMGGMGAVYEAEHTHLRKRVAVKLLRPELARDEAFRRRFLREARAASAVAHPHVVAISDSGETEDGHVFLAMELLAGEDLRELLARERILPWPRVRAILLQVTSALRAAHARKVVHRDIKPSNVFLVDPPAEESGDGPRDFIKLVDFGIAKLTGNADDSSAELTSPQQIVGTVAYISPEMAMGVKDDPRSDIYAVGVMMYKMLTGELPFGEGNALGILAQHIHAPIPSVRDRQPSVPVAVEAIVVKAMAKRADDRFATMAAFRRALEETDAVEVEATQLLEPMGIGEGGATPGEPTELISRARDETHNAPHEEGGRSRRGIVASVLAAAGVVLLAWWVAIARDDGPAVSTAAAVIEQPAPDSTASEPSVPSPQTPVIPDPEAGPEIGATDGVADFVTTSGTEPSLEETGVTGSVGTTGQHDGPPSPMPAPRKPKTDGQVVAALAAKIRARCRRQLQGRVRVEGMIASTGRVQSLLVTPQGGLGECETLVKSARFGRHGGGRPMPRFWVEP